MFTVDFDGAIRDVLSSGGQVHFKKQYNLDVNNYSWVADYMRDKKLRKEIKRLQKEITTTQQSLIDRDELRAMFEAGIEQVRRDFLELLKEHLTKAQRRKEPIVGGLHSFGVISNRLPMMSLQLVSSEEIGDIIAGLPVGITCKEIEKTVEGLRAQIAKHNETIEKELSPHERWFYSDQGEPLRYPGGCRWTKFVEGWKMVVARFDGKVDIEGCALKTDDEFAAFHMLELDNVLKLTPLRKPWKK